MLWHKITLVFLRNREHHNDDGLCPGDVFHPDYQHGCPAYFNIFVHSTTQPSFVSSSASCAGEAVAAGEVAKDEKHLAAVEEVGLDFIPLVVETFGVWTQFALKILYAIADLPPLVVEFPKKWPGGICYNNCQCNCG